MQRLQRTEYLNKLIAFRDKHVIKIVTGIRSQSAVYAEPVFRIIEQHRITSFVLFFPLYRICGRISTGK